MATRLSSQQRQWNEAIQKRLTATSRLLSQMREVKQLAMTEKLCHIIEILRSDEIEISSSYRWLLAKVLTICASSPQALPCPRRYSSLLTIIQPK